MSVVPPAIFSIDALSRQLGAAENRAAETRRHASEVRERLASLEKSTATWRKEARDLTTRLQRQKDEFLDAVSENLQRHADPRALRRGNPSDAAKCRPSPRPISAAKPGRGLSIVLGTYNRLETLKLTIESIRSQSIPCHHEIIVVDGGSTDGTIEWLSQQLDILTIIQHNRVPGRAKRSWGYFMNLAFRSAEGKYVLMLSDDCLLVPGSIANAISYVESLEREGRAVGGVAFYFRNWPADRQYFVQKTLGGMLMVNHGLFSKEALVAVGFAEEELYDFYKADSDLSLKIWYAGYEIVPCDTAFVEHLLRPEEELRIGNNATLDRDRDALIERWSWIYVHRDLPDVFHPPQRVNIDFVDAHNTASAFERLENATNAC